MLALNDLYRKAKPQGYALFCAMVRGFFGFSETANGETASPIAAIHRIYIAKVAEV
jgi:hypothetical protein